MERVGKKKIYLQFLNERGDKVLFVRVVQATRAVRRKNMVDEP